MLKKFLLGIGFGIIIQMPVFCDSECNGEKGAGCENIPTWRAPEIITSSDADIKSENWSGGANMDNNKELLSGFNTQNSSVVLSLGVEEMPTDDEISVLSVSRSVDPYADVYNYSSDLYTGKYFSDDTDEDTANTDINSNANDYSGMYFADGEELTIVNEPVFTHKCSKSNKKCINKKDKQAIITNAFPIMDAWNKDLIDLNVSMKSDDTVVRQWVITQGATLRTVLEDWSKEVGWDVVWNTTREYPIQASAVFNGRFMDVASALVRNFSRAQPAPYAKFYKGNKVIVVQTVGGENDN